MDLRPTILKSDVATGNSVNLRVRSPEDYPGKLKRILDLITFNEVPKVVGSYAYLNHKYPSDVDVFDKVVLSLGPDEAAEFYAQKFKVIMETLLTSHPNIFIMDFKMGEDPSLRDLYDDFDTKNLSTKAILTKVLEEDQVKSIYSDDNPKEALRGYLILRWTPEEVLLGVKKLSRGRSLSIIDAIKQPAISKLDVVTYISDRYMSVEVVYNLGYTEGTEGTGDLKEVSFYPLGDYAESIIKDIDKYGDSTSKIYAPLKVAKRLWSLSRIANCGSLFDALAPLIESDAAALNQIKSDLEIISDIINLEPLTFSYLKVLNKAAEIYKLHGKLAYVDVLERVTVEILHCSKRMSNHMSYEKYRDLNPSFEVIFNEWALFKATGVYNVKLVTKVLEDLGNILKKEISIQASDYLSTVVQFRSACIQIFKK
jgi:hypothetical protein